MKAWILTKQAPVETNPLALVTLPDPHPGPGEIRIRVITCGVCRTDAHIAEGDLPLHKTPLVLGHEIVGVVDEIGAGVTRFSPGDRAGVTWLHDACGRCKFCQEGKENLCEHARFTGWDADGGFAEYTVVKAAFAQPLPASRSFVEMAPWMCPGTAGYRALRLTGLHEGQRLGLYGFGPTATYVLQAAHGLGIEVYVVTRSEKNKAAARQYGADWIGDYADALPVKLDGGIIFPPVGDLVPFALAQLDKNGRLVLGPVTMTPITIADFNLIWGERSIISLAHVTREDARGFIQLADASDIQVGIETYPFERLPEALIAVRHSRVKGNAVIQIG
ncbi:MAG TPA: zinc-dependent alcohol dehydrogenase family protein [Caldilineae bacterium]|nr:zinc-dependent alcohol dehydrogenase family protein [Caldilineae bacterium]